MKWLLSIVIVLGVLLALLPHLVWGVGWCVCRPFGYHLPYAPFGWLALGLVCLALLIMSYGVWIGRWKTVVTELDYHHDSIPASFADFRIVHISDLHLSTFDDNPRQLERIVEQINGLNPDLICFTGDLVSLYPEELQPYIGTLSRLQSTHGVCSVLGNHDFFLYSRNYTSDTEREAAVDSLARMQREKLGWHLLRNEHFSISRASDTLTIIGVDNTNCGNQGFRTINRGNLPEAMRNTSGFRILLSHDPSHWSYEVVPKTDIPLTLSGHTHAAQIRLFGWTPAKWTFEHTYGLYRQGNQSLYINIGLGCTAPIRLGANPEITLITLRP